MIISHDNPSRLISIMALPSPPNSPERADACFSLPLIPYRPYFPLSMRVTKLTHGQAPTAIYCFIAARQKRSGDIYYTALPPAALPPISADACLYDKYRCFIAGPSASWRDTLMSKFPSRRQPVSRHAREARRSSLAFRADIILPAIVADDIISSYVTQNYH